MDYPLKMTEQLRPQLQALRKKRGFTQAKLGEAIGVTQARIVEIEANPGGVNLQQVMQVLSALGATLVIRETESGRAKADQDAEVSPAADKTTGTSIPSPKRGSW